MLARLGPIQRPGALLARLKSPAVFSFPAERCLTTATWEIVLSVEIPGRMEVGPHPFAYGPLHLVNVGVSRLTVSAKLHPSGAP